MFIEALFTIVNIWKQPKCPSTDEWIKKILYVYTVAYCSVVENKIMPTEATWMGLEIVILISQTEKDKNHMVLLICGIYKK